jgi:hypothetical protein
MPFSGVFPAVEVVAAPFGLSSESATIVRHTFTDSHWVGGYAQEYGLCGIKVEGWNLCASAPSATYHDSLNAERYGKLLPFDVVVIDGCDSPLGPSHRDEREQRLMDLLDVASLKAAERELWSGPATISNQPVAANRNKYLSDGNATATGAATNPFAALAKLEDALASCGAGEQGVIHMTRGTAAILGATALRVEGGKLVTMAGTDVIAGSGYTATTATTATMYATGPVVAHLGAAAMLSENDADYFTASSNKFVLRAERPVSVTWDGCCQISALVDYTA